MILGATAAAVRPAAAQHITSPYRFLTNSQELEFFAGHLTGNAGTAGLGVSAASVFGARYDIRVSGPFNFEGGVTLFPTTRSVLDTTTAAQDTFFHAVGQAKTTLAIVDAGVRFDLTGPRTFHRLLPYLEAGIAAVLRARDQASAADSVAAVLRYSPGTRFAGMVGAGVEWTPAEHVGLRLDARDYLWRITAPVGFLVLSPSVPAKEWLQHYSVSVGLVFRF